MILATREERVKLLKQGFTGKEIEKLYLVLNNFTVIGEIETRLPPKEDEGTPSPSSSYPMFAAEAMA